MDEIISGAFISMPREKLIADLLVASIAFGQVNNLGALSTHPALRRIEVPTETGSVTCVAPAARFNHADRGVSAVPALGQHSQEIRAEFTDDD